MKRFKKLIPLVLAACLLAALQWVSAAGNTYLSIDSLPDELVYSVGESLDTTGMELTLWTDYDSYSEGTSVSLSSVTFSYNFSTYGRKTVTVKYGAYRAYFTAYVTYMPETLIDPAEYPYPESDHPYSGSSRRTFTYPGAAALRVVFSSDCDLHQSTSERRDDDELYVDDGEGNELLCTRYPSGKSVLIPGDTFTVGILYDQSNNDDSYGYSISSIYVVDCHHVYDDGKVTQSVNCVRDGIKVYTCQGCGETYEEITPMLSEDGTHTFDHSALPKNPYGSTTSTYHVCSVCGSGGALAAGSCGSGAWYVLNSDGTLVLYGSGAVTSPGWDSRSTSVKSIYIQEGITSLSSQLFYNHYSAAKLHIPSTLTSIGSRAFYNCSGLTEVDFGDADVTVESSAFGNCTDLTHIDFGTGSVELVDIAFVYCTGLEEVDIPANVTLGYGAFQHCSGLKRASVASETVGQYTFELCTSLSDLTIHEGVKTVKYGVFRCTTALTEVVFPASLESLEEYAFNRGSVEAGIKDIWFYNPRTQIDDHALNVSQSVTVHGYNCSTAHKFASEKPRYSFVPMDGDTTEHTPAAVPGTPATCTGEGLTDGSACSVCGMTLTEQTAIPATGHSFGEWAVTVEPGYLTPGEEQRCCTACPEIETNALPATGQQVADSLVPVIGADGVLTVTGIPDDLILIAAVYNGDRLVRVLSMGGGDTLTCTVPRDVTADSLQVFYLDSLLRPIARPWSTGEF